MSAALAEAGDFKGAITWQQAAHQAASAAQNQAVVQRLECRLGGYRQGKPCREPWSEDIPEGSLISVTAPTE